MNDQTKRTTSIRIGARQEQLLRILAYGPSRSRSALYSQLDYRGGSSNYYGSLVLDRLEARGMVKRSPGPRNAIAVAITALGHRALDAREVAS